MTSYRNDALNRLVAMEKEALDAYVVANWPEKTGVDSVPRLIHTQETFPYIVHIWGAGENVSEDEDNSLVNYDVRIRFVCAHIDSGYSGEYETHLHEMIPLLEQYLSERPMLKTDSGSYTDWPDYLLPEGFTVGTTLGIEAFPIGGTGTVQIGEELSITIPIMRYIVP